MFSIILSHLNDLLDSTMTLQKQEYTVNQQPPSTFIWRELMCVDVQAATSFYGSMFGWSLERLGAQYSVFLDQKNIPIGGVVNTTQAPELIPHWTNFIEVSQLSKTLARAQSLGASICIDPTQVNELGEVAVIQSPNESLISLMQPHANTPYRHTISEHPGHICWQELHTTHIEEDLRFYQQLFDWRIDQMQLEGWGTYHSISSGVAPVGGAYEQEPASKPMWLPYICVDDLDRAVDRAMDCGARIAMTPRDIQNSGRMAMIHTPTDEQIGLFSM